MYSLVMYMNVFMGLVRALGAIAIVLVCFVVRLEAQVGTPCLCSSGLSGRCLTSSATISQPGLYCVTQDFSSSNPFHISADDVVLDGQGHKMTVATGGEFLTIAKGDDPALPSFKIRTFNVHVRNFEVVAKNVNFNEMIIFDTVSNSTMENVSIKLIGGAANTGAKLMGMYQSYLNRFIGNTFLMANTSGGADLLSLRNGTCGTQFINNTFVGSGLASSGHFIKLNAGDQTLGRNSVGDTVFSGNRIYSNLDGIMDQSHEPNTYVTLDRNLIYSNGIGLNGSSSQNALFSVTGNTIISLNDRPFTIGDADNRNVRLDMKNNIFFAAGGDLTLDLHAETINSNFNNFYTSSISPIIWSKYDGRGVVASNSLFGCLTGCANPWRTSSRDSNSLSIGPTLGALFLNPSVNLALDNNDNPTSLGDFTLKPTSGLRAMGEGGVDLGSAGGNGGVYPLKCNAAKPGLIAADSIAPSSPGGLRIVPGSV